MIWINFRKWSAHYSRMFVWYRIYMSTKKRGPVWTPFIYAVPRYSWEFNAHFKLGTT